MIGETKTCEAKAGSELCINCDYTITDPTGKKFGGKTDENGNFALPLSMNGTYKIALLKDGLPVKTVEIRSIPVSNPIGENPPVVSSGPDAGSMVLSLLVLLALCLAAVLYWRGRGSKRAKPKEAGAGAAKK
jgi:hypothetical protein